MAVSVLASMAAMSGNVGIPASKVLLHREYTCKFLICGTISNKFHS